MKLQKLLPLLIIALLGASLPLHATIVTITTVGNKFSPDSVIARWGDTIQFTNMTGKIAIEVSSTTWNNNAKTALSGGFNSVNSSNNIIGLTTGLHYYVDTHFVSTDTMKGRIYVLPRIQALTDCNDLFISEYIEGSGNNKAIEIFNPTSTAKSLTGYSLVLYSNGAILPSNTTTLSGTIQPDTTYVLANASSTAGILAKANVTNSSTMTFNGNDAIALIYNNTIVDVFGEIGQNPGTYWIMNGTDSSKDMTFVKKASIKKGSTNWLNSSANEWITYPKDTFSNLADHVMTPCSTTPVVKFALVKDSIIENIGSKNYTITITNPSGVASSVDVVKIGGTATDGVDYNFSNQTVNFAAGSSAPKTISFTVLDDLIQEGNETIQLALRNTTGTNTIGADSILTITISDNDTFKVVFSSISSTVGEAAGTVQIGVRMASYNPNSVNTNINLKVKSGTATLTSDYTLGTSNFSIGATDTTTKYFTVNIVDDVLAEGNENIIFGISSTSGIDTTAPQHTMTIIDNEITPKLQFVAVASNVNENAGTHTIQVKLNAPNSNPTSVNIAAFGGTASGADYALGTTLVTFAANDSTPKNVTINISEDNIVEGTETFKLRMLNPTNTSTIGVDSIHTVSIIDNDTLKAVYTSSSSSYSEGVGRVYVGVKLINRSPNPTIVTLNTPTGTATNNTDYIGDTVSVTFAALDTSTKYFSALILDDISVEGNETIIADFTANNGAITTGQVHTLTIVDNDTLKASFVVNTSNFSENSGSVQVGVKLNAFSPNPTKVKLNIPSGTASNSVDYNITLDSVSFAANDTATKNFNISIVNDINIESTETIDLSLNATNGGLTSGQNHTLNILDNDTLKAIFILPSSSFSEAAGTAQIGVKLTAFSPNPTNVNASVIVGGTATPIADFTPIVVAANFAANDTATKYFSASINDDIIVEGDETFIIGLSGNNGVVTAGQQHIGTIVDNDFSPVIEFNTITSNASESNATHNFQIKLKNKSTNTTSATITAFAGTANGSDYSIGTGTVTFLANDTTPKTVSLNITDDIIIEGNETIQFRLTGLTNNASIGKDSIHTVTIADNDTLKAFFISSTSSVNESAGKARFGVKLNAFSPNPTTLNLNAATGTALLTSDYSNDTSTLVFAANDTATKYFTKNIVDDVLVEGNETIISTMNGNNGVIVTGQSHTVTILDNDLTQFNFSNIALTRNEGSGSQNFNVSVSSTPTVNASVDVVLGVGSTASTTSDYVFSTQTLNFPSGSSANQNFSVTLPDDLLVEGNETLILKLKNAIGGITIGSDSVFTLTIQDNDTLKAKFGKLSQTVVEGSAATQIPVKLTAFYNAPTTVNIGIYASGTNSATINTDYTLSSTSIVIPANDTNTYQVNMTSIEDIIVEGTETATFEISSVNNGGISNGSTFTYNIQDNDTLKVEFVKSASSFLESAGTVQIGVKLKAFSPNPTSVTANVIAGGTATVLVDFTPLTVNVNFTANDTSTRYFTANIIDDILIEGNETFIIGMSSNNGGITTGQQHIGTIIDNEVQPNLKFELANSSAVESKGTHTFKVKITNANASATSATITAIGGTANGLDYILGNSTVIFNSNDSADKTISINIVDDILVENTETIQFKLTAPTNNALIIADSIHTVSIVDNDTLKIAFVNSISQFNENNGTVKIAVKMTNMSSNSTSVSVVSNGGTAIASDYSIPNSTITWNANDTSTKFIDISIVDDKLDEINETLILKLQNANNNAIITQANHTLTIVDNDTAGVAINTTSIEGLKIYPNPLIDKLNIESNELINEISIIDFNGKIVQSIKPNSMNAILNFDAIEAGKYILEIKTADKTEHQPIIKQ